MKEYKCSKCRNVYYSRDDLRYHIFNDHLYPTISLKTLDEVSQDDHATRVTAIDEGQRSVLNELLTNNSASDEFKEIVNEIAADKASGYTHEILRNNEGRCVVVARNQPRPPHWKVYHTGDEASCRSYLHTKCGAGQGGNKC